MYRLKNCMSAMIFGVHNRLTVCLVYDRLNSYGNASTFTYIMLSSISKKHVKTDTGLLYIELSNCLDK